MGYNIEEIKKMYIEQDLKAHEVAKIIEVPTQSLRRYLSKNKISKNGIKRTCGKCGKEFVSSAGRKYCIKCAPKVIKKNDADEFVIHGPEPAIKRTERVKPYVTFRPGPIDPYYQKLFDQQFRKWKGA